MWVWCQKVYYHRDQVKKNFLYLFDVPSMYSTSNNNNDKSNLFISFKYHPTGSTIGGKVLDWTKKVKLSENLRPKFTKWN